jgi:hypothetical protein
MTFRHYEFQPLILRIAAGTKNLAGSRIISWLLPAISFPHDTYPNTAERENLKNCKVIARNYSFQLLKPDYSTCQIYTTQGLPLL